MTRHPCLAVLAAATLVAAGARPRAAAGSPPPGTSAQDIVAKMLDADPWGTGGAVVVAHASLRDKRGAASELAFTARSRRHDGSLSKSIVRFTAPADLAGAGFLQVQNREQDDDRFLFLPELKRSRRISGNLRGNSFMGTDFSFADLDRRDFRDSTATSMPDADIARFPCFHVDVVSKRADSPYAHIEVWIRKDNYLPLRMEMFDRAQVKVKTFTAQEVKRVSGHWYITRSRMVDHVQSHTTDLTIDSITPTSDLADDEFSVRNLEKL